MAEIDEADENGNHCYLTTIDKLRCASFSNKRKPTDLMKHQHSGATVRRTPLVLLPRDDRNNYRVRVRK